MSITNNHRSCSTHCCINHGCAYGYVDCPVKTEAVQQEYLCEWCDNGSESARPKTIVVPVQVHLRRADGTIKDIPKEEVVLAAVTQFLIDQEFNGWTVTEVY